VTCSPDYASHNRGVLKPNDRAMIECLVEMHTLEAQYPTYTIMDAIGECPLLSSVPSPREDVLELVDELVRAHLQNLHTFVTSRRTRHSNRLKHSSDL